MDQEKLEALYNFRDYVLFPNRWPRHTPTHVLIKYHTTYFSSVLEQLIT